MRVHMRGLGYCTDMDEEGNCIGYSDDSYTIQTPYGSVAGDGSTQIVTLPASGGASYPPSNPVGSTQSAAQTAAQISNAANQLLLTSQGRGVYTANGVQYIQPQGNQANVFAGTNTTGSVSAAGSIGGISTSTLMLLAIAAVAFVVISKAGK